MRLAGRRACVVGVGSAIGRACVARLVAEGAEVLAVDPSDGAARGLCDELGEAVIPHQAALTSADDGGAVAARCEQMWGRLDILTVCGSSMELWPEEEDTVARWRDVFEVNVAGPATYTLALEPLLRRSQWGSVVYLGSIDGILGNPRVPAYSVTKAGLLPLTHTMAQILGGAGIRVNCVATAGIVQTAPDAGSLRRDVGDPARARALTPLGRMPDPDEIASVVCFFASDDASYVTGTVLPVDGGRTAATPGTW